MIGIAEVTGLGIGLHADLSAGEYHRLKFCSQSRLKTLRDRSPAHVYEAMMNPPESTPAQRIGTAVHTAVLQPDLFTSEYAVAPECDRRTRAGKAAWEEFCAEHEGAMILRRDDYDLCLAVRDAVQVHPVAPRILAGQREMSAVWHDADTGVTCKGRFDATPGFGALGDLKTTTDASKRAFMRSVYTYGYYMQAAHYLDGAKALGIDADVFAIVAVEKTPPYAVAVYQIEGEALKAGRDELRPLLETWARCEASGVWPGYEATIERISLPRCGWYEIDERLGVGVDG